MALTTEMTTATKMSFVTFGGTVGFVTDTTITQKAIKRNNDDNINAKRDE